MAQDGFTIDMGFNPVLNVDKLNVMLNHVKQSLGSLGSDIKMIDGNKMAADMKKFDTELVQAGKHTDGLKKGFKETEGSLGKLKEGLKQGFNIAVGMGGFELLKEGFKEIVKGGVEFQASLADLSALTGVSGKALDGLGGRAREMSKEFGTTAVQQITSMKGVLSRFGPDLAKTPESLAAITKSINILGEASGMDAATSMDALTNSMLQFGVDITNPATAAKESARFINVLGASAKEGAAEIPQISEAIVNAGVACQQSNVSFEMANAALQVLAQGGKTGAEAGIGLRNVLMKISSIKMIPPDVRKDLQGLGVDLGIVTNSALPLNVRMKELGKAAGDAGTMTKLWGLENATTGALLIKGADQMDTFNKKMTGTNVAYDQARINSQTFEAQVKRLKSTMQDLLISGFQAVQPAIGLFLGGLTFASKNIGAVLVPMGLLTAAFILYKANAIKAAAVQLATNFSSMIAPVTKLATTIVSSLVPGLISQNIATKGIILNTNMLTMANIKAGIAQTAATVKQWLWNAAMAANPLGVFLIAIMAVVGGIFLLRNALIKSNEAQIKENEEKIKTIKADEEGVQKKKSVIESNIKLVESFKKQGKSAMDNKTLLQQLDKIYPGVIDKTKTFDENLQNLEKSTTGSKGKIKELNDEISKLKSKEIHLTIVVDKQKVKKEAEDLREQLQNAIPSVGYSIASNFMEHISSAKDTDEMQAIYNKIVAEIKAGEKKGTFNKEQTNMAITALANYTREAKKLRKDYQESNKKDIFEAYDKQIEKGKAAGMDEVTNEKMSLEAGSKLLKDKFKKDWGDKTEIERQNHVKDLLLARKRAAEKAKAGDIPPVIPPIPPTPKEGPSAYELALKVYEKLNKEKALAVETTKLEVDGKDLMTGRIKSEVELEQESLDIQKAKTIELQRQLEYYTSNVLTVAKSGDESDAANEAIVKLRNDIKASGNDVLKIGIKIAQTQKKSEEEIAKLQAQYDRSNLQLQIKTGIKLNTDLLEFDKAALQSSCDNLSNKISESTDEGVKWNLKVEQIGIIGQIDDIDLAIADAKEQKRLANIKDAAKQERETRISEAKKALKQQLFDVKGNINLEMAARSEYYLKLNDAEKAFAATQRTNIFGLQVPLNLMAMSFGASLNDVFANLSFSSGDSQKTTELKDQKNKLKTEEDALFESLRKREISQRDYYDKLTDLQNQQKELTKEIAAEQTSVWKEMGSALGKSMQSLGTAGLGESLVKYKDNSVIIQGIDKEITDKKAEQLLRQLELAEISTQLDDKKRAELTAKQKQTSDELIDLEKRKSDAIDISSAASNKAYTSMAITAIGATAELIANGKLTWKSLLLIGINALQNMVPLWSAQILGMEFASKGILGAITAGAAVLALNVAVAVAKAAVSGAKFFKGGYTGNSGIHNAAGVVHGQEFVFDNVMTRQYLPEFEKRHKEGLSATAYVTKYEPEFLAKVAEKNGKESQEYKVMISQNQELIYENKELRKELIRNTEEVQNLKATFSHNSAVKVTGTFKAEGDDFRANIEKAKQVTMARS